MDTLILQQRQAIQKLLDARNLLPTQLAKKCKVSPSTMTRFMNSPAVTHALSARTIQKIRDNYPEFDGLSEDDALEVLALDEIGKAIRAHPEAAEQLREIYRDTIRALRSLGERGHDPQVVETVVRTAILRFV